MEYEPYRGELIAYCYRMLGSFHDAEDLAQETMLRAWKARDPTTEPGVGAHLAVPDRHQRLPDGAGGHGPPAAALRAGRARRRSPGCRSPRRSTSPGCSRSPTRGWTRRRGPTCGSHWWPRVQFLPPRQRAVLLLREVLDFSAAEVAGHLGTTVPAVNSALQRARAALTAVGDIDEVTEPDDPRTRAVIDRYARAFEAADVPALVRLLADDAILEMPPVPLWFRGSRDYGRFMERVFQTRGTGWVVERLTANGQPALAAYAPQPAGGFKPHTLQVFTVTGGRVARNVVFADPAVFELFGLPAQISAPTRFPPSAMSPAGAAGMYPRALAEGAIRGAVACFDRTRIAPPGRTSPRSSCPTPISAWTR